MAELSRDKFIIEGSNDSEANILVRPNIGYWQDAWRRLKKNKVAIASLVILSLIVLMCIIGPSLSPHPFDTQNYEVLDKTPNASYWFGTDNLGRDLFVRLWRGGRVSLYIGFFGTIIEVVIGLVLGGIAGFFAGGLADIIIMRIIEIIVAIPYLIQVILLLLVLPPGVTTIIIAMCIGGWTAPTRLIRGQVLQLKSSEYVLAAQALGASTARIIAKHLLPNTIGVLLVYVTFDIPGFIFAEAFLSFVGLGVQPPDTSWGVLVFAGQGTFMNHPHELIFPALAISLTMLSFNLLGDGLRDALDPKLRQ